MLRYLAQGGPLAGVVAAVVIGFFGHNLAQAWSARALGDPTAVRAGFGRLGWLQLDPLGVATAALTVGAWGFTAEVPVDSRLRRSRSRAALALMAGPVLLLALTTLFVGLGSQGLSSTFLSRADIYASYCSGGLFVTSMIPIPPLALGRTLWMYAPTTSGWANARYRLQEDNLGRLIAFAILMIPLIFGAFPNLVGEFVPGLLRDLSRLFGGS